MKITQERENDRLAMIRSLDLVGAADYPELDRITGLVAHAFDMPTVLISLVESERQCFLSKVGFGADGTERSISICTHTIEQSDVLEIADLQQDIRFAQNPLVTGGPRIRFYAGAPLLTGSGHAIGSLCLIDYLPRSLDQAGRQRLQDYATLVVDQLKLRRSIGRVDGVSGLHNRQQFVADLAALADVEDQHAAMFLIDVLDVQSTHLLAQSKGMRPVEALIRQASIRILQAMPADAELYHVGVARFAFVVTTLHAHNLQQQAALITSVFQEPLSTEGVKLRVATRIGIVPFERKHWDDVARRAISAVQQSTDTDAPWMFYDPVYDQTAQRKLRIAADAPRALANGEFRLVYQPRYSYQTNAYPSGEALLRWCHPELGEISPGEFIPILEKTALMPEVTEWVFEHVAQQLSAWNAQGNRITISLNVTAADFAENRLPGLAARLLGHYGVQAQAIQMEITEGEWLRPDSAAVQQIRALRAVGIGIYLDDFGAGFSNFGYLTQLPIDGIKIDQALIFGMEQDRLKKAVVQPVIQMAQAMGFSVVAEGVETLAQSALLQRWGCDEAQGFLLSRPLPPDDFIHFIAGHAHATDEAALAAM